MIQYNNLIIGLENLLKDLKSNLNSKSAMEPNCIMTLGDIAQRLADKFNVEYNVMAHWVNKLYKINPGSCISLFAKEIAIILDANYPDHITKNEKFYVLSLTDGCIHECNTTIKNHECIALFRSLDDAKYACKVLKPWLKDLYGKQKNKKY